MEIKSSQLADKLFFRQEKNSQQPSVDLQTKNTTDSVPTSIYVTQVDNELLDEVLKKELIKSFNKAHEDDLAIKLETRKSKYQSNAIEYAERIISSNFHSGLIDNMHANDLNKLIEKNAENITHAYKSTSDILSAIGQLGAEQKTFLSRSQFQVERKLNNIFEEMMRTEKEQDDGRSFKLALQTKEGDNIIIQFHSSQGYDEENNKAIDEFEVSYQVDGELSEKEHNAIVNILNKSGEFVDQYFSTNIPAHVNILEGFDSSQLSSIELEVDSGDIWSKGNGSLELNYRIDEVDMQQHLSVNRYDSQSRQSQFKISADLAGQTSKKNTDDYLELISSKFKDNYEKNPWQGNWFNRDSLRQSSEYEMMESYKNSLKAMFDIASNYSQLEDVANEHFSRGNDLIADITKKMVNSDSRFLKSEQSASEMFLANFDSDFITVNADKMSNRRDYHFSLGQKTVVDDTQDSINMKQKNYYKSEFIGDTVFGEKRSIVDEGSTVQELFIDRKNSIMVSILTEHSNKVLEGQIVNGGLKYANEPQSQNMLAIVEFIKSLGK